MKKRELIIPIIVCIGSMFIINTIIVLFLHHQDLDTGMAILLENTLMLFGLLLMVIFITSALRVGHIRNTLTSHRKFVGNVISGSESCLAIFDERGSFEYASLRFRKLLDIGEDLEINGCSAVQLLPKNVYQFLMQRALCPHPDEQEPIKDSVQIKDLSFTASAFTVFDGEDQPKCVLALYDLTHHLLLEQQLVSHLEEIQFHVEAREALLANISHELKTPLNAITGLSRILEESGLTGRQKEIVEKINTSSDYLMSVINDIMDLSKLKNGAITVNPASFRLQDLFDDLEKRFQPVAEKKGIRLLKNYRFDPDLWLDLDLVLIQQVMSNLINNACKFTDVGYVRISASVLKEFRDTLTLKISVEDTGIGIDQKDLTSIFNEFFQVEGHLTKMHSGTGLGLPICKRLIEQMGGNLWAESNIGVGSIFSFSLTAPKHYSARESQSSMYSSLKGNGEKILVVEDMPINYEVAQELLSHVNLVCEHASSGPVALQMCENVDNGYYSAILMDIHMPIMDGYETARKLKEMGVTTPIIALTATNMNEEVRMRHRNLFHDFVLKPFKYTRLYNALEPFIGQPGSDAGSREPATEPEETDPFSGREQAIENLGGSTELYLKHLGKFQKNYAASGDTLKGYIQSDRLDDAKILSHSIKGLAGTLGLTALAEAAKALEESIDNGSSDLTPQLAYFQEKLDQVVSR